MHSSKFCLDPAGSTPASYRLFDAIVSMCVLVIVSDRIELPFENVFFFGYNIDYSNLLAIVNILQIFVDCNIYCPDAF